MTKFISWYRPPFGGHNQYLCSCPDGDGFYYSRDYSQAHLFETSEEAWHKTPAYDGSSGIESRAGVQTVIELVEHKSQLKQIATIMLVTVALAGLALLWYSGALKRGPDSPQPTQTPWEYRP